jgi:DNA-damage-inducible protein D
MNFYNINWAISKLPFKRRSPMVLNNNEIEVFHFDGSKANFDDMGHDNDIRYWYARDLMQLLEYESYSTFRSVVNKAISACASLNINITENFIEIKREINNKNTPDFKLSRFACYLIAMNGDPKKSQVAKAQVYFAAIAETFRNYIESSENVERVLIRDEVSDREKSLSDVAYEHGVDQYQYFQNAGYRGLYNKNISDLKAYKGFDQIKISLLDFMGLD